MCVCVDYGRLWRRSDRPQSNDDHSHMNCNEFQKINYLEMVDTVHCVAISSRSRTYSECLFILPYPSCVCLCVFYYFFTFLLRLIFIGAEQEKQTGPKTTSIFLGSTCARIPAHKHTRTQGNDDGFSSKLSGRSNVYLFIAATKTKRTSN